MPDLIEQLEGSRRARPASLMPLCSTSTSVIWREIRRYGLSEVIGSWKIIASRTPRIRFSSRAGRFRSSWPRKRALPVQRPFLASRPMIERKAWVLPEPDSPTTPTLSP